MGTTTRSTAIGDGWAVDGNAQFDGLIDEVRISNAARSAEWIEASYLSQNGTFNTFSGAQDATVDGAAPVIVNAATTLGSTTLTVYLSEPVDTSNAGAGDLATTDFSYNNVFVGGATGMTSMGADADGTDEVVTITVDAPFAAGDNANDTLAAAAMEIYDLVDIPAATTPVTIVFGLPMLSSASNQTFGVGGPTAAAATLTITDTVGGGTFTTTNDLRIRIPAGFNMIWDTSVTSVTIGGGAAGKVSTTLLAYEDSNQTAVIDVTANFATAEQITVSGLAFTSFTAISALDNLELEVLNDAGLSATDDKTIEILTGNASDPKTKRIHNWDDILAVSALPNVFLEILQVQYPSTRTGDEYPFPMGQKTIEDAHRRLGAEKLVWGADMPALERACTYRQSLDYVRFHCPFMNAREKDRVLGDNAAEIFGLK